jgi:hypothetical protein
MKEGRKFAGCSVLLCLSCVVMCCLVFLSCLDLRGVVLYSVRLSMSCRASPFFVFSCLLLPCLVFCGIVLCCVTVVLSRCVVFIPISSCVCFSPFLL